MSETKVPVPGSERKPVTGAVPGGAPDPNHVIEVTVVLKPKAPPHNLPSAEALGLQLPSQRTYLTRAELENSRGADPADAAKIETFAHDHDLTVVSVDLARRSIVLSGGASAMSQAFGVELQLFSHAQGTFIGRTGPVFVPSGIQDAVVGVFGLDSRPQANPRYRVARTGPSAAGDTSYTPVDVAKLYSFPTISNGKGQSVAIIELGGGYKSAELKSYFAKLGISPTPKITAVSVDGGRNKPAPGANSADGEVLLDIEVIGGIAPGAKISVYFAPNTDKGFLDAITTAVHDRVRKPSVISISWGSAESQWTAQSLQAFNQAFQDASLLGVTVCCASGDDGSTDGQTDGKAHVDFPSSSPFALGCGGTRLESSGGRITQEVVWNHGPGNGASGGGVSDVFPVPTYQTSAGVPVSANPAHNAGRGVPDVAGDADPSTGYQITVDGQNAVFGGTSAVAPLWAGLIALLNEQIGKPVGFLNPLIYGAARNALNDITSGTNGAYAAAPGWDACTGMGSPDGAKLLVALRG
ncbi:MAG: S53 family peptidase [Acidobacteriota bacterium]|nr:S53 family peptidase [Acidobacteriota bacterium]